MFSGNEHVLQSGTTNHGALYTGGATLGPDIDGHVLITRDGGLNAPAGRDFIAYRALPGEGYHLVVEVFMETGPRGRIATWNLDIRRPLSHAY